MENPVSTVVDGKVTGITKFGAFVSIPGGRTGMVHISEIANTYVNDIREHLTEGQEVKVKIIGTDKEGRINLSIKKALEPVPAPSGGQRPSRPAAGARGRPSGPLTFEDKLKQFMQTSDSKMSDLRAPADRRPKRRGGGSAEHDGAGDWEE
jgi:S1 RNA binding domain protein